MPIKQTETEVNTESSENRSESGKNTKKKRHNEGKKEDVNKGVRGRIFGDGCCKRCKT